MLNHWKTYPLSIKFRYIYLIFFVANFIVSLFKSKNPLFYIPGCILLFYLANVRNLTLFQSVFGILYALAAPIFAHTLVNGRKEPWRWWISAAYLLLDITFVLSGSADISKLPEQTIFLRYWNSILQLGVDLFFAAWSIVVIWENNEGLRLKMKSLFHK